MSWQELVVVEIVIKIDIYAVKAKLFERFGLKDEDLACLLWSAVCDRRTLPMGKTPNAAIAHLYIGWGVFSDRVQLQQVDQLALAAAN